ncbi:unnamed protein product [Trichogramma brassicae]|uniref:CHK kinase-like domain-containing protein n=1 Tax=Trichogramma brassicae TaxID=86971 RepID=A0A6H5IW64_9HYME|nr:unnamed protein product [Trichogramma brassicae]
MEVSESDPLSLDSEANRQPEEQQQQEQEQEQEQPQEQQKVLRIRPAPRAKQQRDQSFYHFSRSDIKEILDKVLTLDGKELEIISYVARPIARPSEGGVVNRLYRLIVGYRLTSPANPDERTRPEVLRFLVWPLISSQDRYDFLRGEDGSLKPWDNEAHFWAGIMPVLEANCRAEPFTPRRLLVNSRVVVFEDLREQGWYMYLKRPPRLPTDHLYAALRALARYHAAVESTERETDLTLGQMLVRGADDDGDGSVSFEENNSEENDSDEGQAGDEASNSSSTRPPLDWVNIDLTLELIEAICRQTGMDSSRVRTGFLQAFGSVMSWDQTNQLVKRTLNQADLWPCHLFFQQPPGQPPGKFMPACRFVAGGFDLVPHVSRLLDVAELVQLSTSRNQRRCHEAAMLEDYHRALCRALEENQRDDSTPLLPTFEDVLAEYEAVRVAGLYLAAMQLSLPRRWSSWSRRQPSGCRQRVEHPNVYLRLSVFRRSNEHVWACCRNDPPYRVQLADLCGELVTRLAKMMPMIEVSPAELLDAQNNRIAAAADADVDGAAGAADDQRQQQLQE